MLEEKLAQPEENQDTSDGGRLTPSEVAGEAMTPPRWRENKWKILAGILGILVVVGAVFGAYKLGQRQVQPGPRSTPTPVAVATPTPDPTANWKTYTNTEQGYSIKYPDIWTLEATVFDDENGQKIAEFSPGMITPKEEITCEDYFYRIVHGGPDIEALEIDISFTPISHFYTNKLIKQEKVEIEDRQWNLLVTEQVYEGGFPEWTGIWYPQHYCLRKDNKLFQINFYEKDLSSRNKDLFNLILSTFRFLEVSSPSPASSPLGQITGNWKLYSDNKHAFTFKYPRDWFAEVKDFSQEDARLINLAKQDTPTTFSLSFHIKPDWIGTGNAQYLAKNYEVGGVPASRVDPPKQEKQILERYQTNVYFEKSGRVYVFVCVHNWNKDYLNTCNNILSTIRFLE